MNKYRPHVYLIPEDDANRQIANGFVLHHAVQSLNIQIMPPAGGWAKVLETFKDEYLQVLHNFSDAHVIMLIDFDDAYVGRRDRFEKIIPDDVKSRVFVVGSKVTPEILKSKVKMTLEKIGTSLAQECHGGNRQMWEHDHLKHNKPDLDRLVTAVKPILFQ